MGWYWKLLKLRGAKTKWMWNGCETDKFLMGNFINWFTDSFSDLTKNFHGERDKGYFISCPLPSQNYLFKVSIGNTRTMYKLCSKLTRKTPERRHWRCPGVFVVRFEKILLIFIWLHSWLWTSKYLMGCKASKIFWTQKILYVLD